MTTRTGTLRHGLLIGGVAHKDFELRDCTSADYFAAENEASPEKSLSFSAALVSRQLIRIGDYKGPFSLALLGTLKPGDMRLLNDARDRLELAGNAQPSVEPGSSTETS